MSDIVLRPYQKESVEAVYEHLRTRDDNPCIVLPTGTGKSIVLAKIATDSVCQWRGRVLLLAHVKELLEQNADKIRKIAPQLRVGVYSAGLKRRDTDEQVIVAGIQSVYNKACDLGAFDIIIVDEAHLIAPSGDGMYRTFLNEMKVINPNVRVIGLTATPFRLKGGLICQEDNFLNHICYEAGIKEMIANGYISPLISKAGRTEAKLDELHIRGGEFIADEISSAMDKEEITNAACREIINKTRDRKAVLIFTTSVEHCTHVAEKIAELSGQECAMVTGSTPDGERAEILARIRGEKVKDDFFSYKPPLKFLANVNVLTTGFDAPNIDCIVLLRPTASPGLLIQMCLDLETEILTEHGWKNHNSISASDLVAGFNMLSGGIDFVPIEKIIKRRLHESEYMMEVKAPHLDIRVTNYHDFVYRNRTNKVSNWLKRSAEKMAEFKDSFYIPVASNQDAIGVPLNADEIRFCAWVLSDGCIRDDLAITISQSVNSPYIKNIENVLNNCGFGFSRYRVKRKGDLSRYADSYHYYIGFKNLRGKNKNKQGWNRLFYYLTTRFSVAFRDISIEQLDIFLETLNFANGTKGKTLDYTPRGYCIAMGNHKFLTDDLQSILIQRGYRCNISSFRQKTSFHIKNDPKEQYIIHVKKQLNATIGGTSKSPHRFVKNRCSIQKSHQVKNEQVWCLKNKLGTLVTRRNGKVAILGNCGRGFRLSPETGKTSCLVLDFGENILRHGPIDCIKIKDKTTGSGDAPAKKCPECLSLIHAAYAKCPECGYEFPPPDTTKLQGRASTAGIISGEVTMEEFTVSDTFYSIHQKRNAPLNTPVTMRVDYQIGFQQFKSEWVCPEHTGYARGKFEKWWRERAALGCPIPRSAQEAVALANEGLLAEPESITVKTVAGEKFERVARCKLKERPIMPEPGNDGDEDADWHSNSPQDLGVNKDEEWDDEIPF